jgi:hypothetical protein
MVVTIEQRSSSSPLSVRAQLRTGQSVVCVCSSWMIKLYGNLLVALCQQVQAALVKMIKVQ